MGKYSIGIDFGTLSGRAVMVNIQTGEILAASVYKYPHKVMDIELPSGKNYTIIGNYSILKTT